MNNPKPSALPIQELAAFLGVEGVRDLPPGNMLTSLNQWLSSKRVDYCMTLEMLTDEKWREHREGKEPFICHPKIERRDDLIGTGIEAVGKEGMKWPSYSGTRKAFDAILHAWPFAERLISPLHVSSELAFEIEEIQYRGTTGDDWEIYKSDARKIIQAFCDGATAEEIRSQIDNVEPALAKFHKKAVNGDYKTLCATDCRYTACPNCFPPKSGRQPFRCGGQS